MPDGTRPDGTGLAGTAGLAEDRLIRGLHPQVAERLQLDRLREFDLTRLPSADEEIYLFQAVAKSNQADERLVAMGQVRDLTPLREADGRLVALPELENVLAGCLDAIRIGAGAAAAAQAVRGQPDHDVRLAGGRLHRRGAVPAGAPDPADRVRLRASRKSSSWPAGRTACPRRGQCPTRDRPGRPAPGRRPWPRTAS